LVYRSREWNEDATVGADIGGSVIPIFTDGDLIGEALFDGGGLRERTARFGDCHIG
jgi:hypothetical protein